MKTVKVLMIATLLVFTAVSITSADGFKQKPKSKIINVSMIQALGVPGLPAAMLQQLDAEQLIGCGCSSYYIADVTLQSVIYRITGTEQEWAAFFNWGGIIIVDDSNIIMGNN